MLIRPVRPGPQKAEPGLNGGAIGSFGRGQFIEQPSEVKRPDAPHQVHVLEWRDDEFSKRCPKLHAACFYYLLEGQEGSRMRKPRRNGFIQASPRISRAGLSPTLVANGCGATPLAWLG